MRERERRRRKRELVNESVISGCSELVRGRERKKSKKEKKREG